MDWLANVVLRYPCRLTMIRAGGSCDHETRCVRGRRLIGQLDHACLLHHLVRATEVVAIRLIEIDEIMMKTPIYPIEELILSG